MDPNKRYMVTIFVIMGVSIGIQMLLPFPYGLILAIFLFIGLPMLIRRQYMSKMGGQGGGMGFFGGDQQPTDKVTVKYVCLVCNMKHKGGECPRCGSKMQRTEF